jgi:hypothetical protein
MKPGILACVVLGAALTIGSGLWHGRASNRWGIPTSVAPAAEKLAGIPSEFGGWRLTRDESLDPKVVEILQCQAHVNRVYQHQETGQTVNVALMLGPPGPISVHTPEVCYSGQGYESEGVRIAFSFAGAAADQKEEFWSVRMKSREEEGASQQVYYAWSAGNHWSKPESPRWTFRSQPYLYKVQIAGIVPDETEGGPAQTPAQGLEDFVREFTAAARPFLLTP